LLTSGQNRFPIDRSAKLIALFVNNVTFGAKLGFRTQSYAYTPIRRFNTIETATQFPKILIKSFGKQVPRIFYALRVALPILGIQSISWM
jgi:hypothetical protein